MCYRGIYWGRPRLKFSKIDYVFIAIYLDFYYRGNYWGRPRLKFSKIYFGFSFCSLPPMCYRGREKVRPSNFSLLPKNFLKFHRRKKILTWTICQKNGKWPPAQQKYNRPGGSPKPKRNRRPRTKYMF